MMNKFVTLEELESGLEFVRGSPSDRGLLKLIVRRPQVDTREVLAEGVLSSDGGLAGDRWRIPRRASARAAAAELEMQLTIMNSRAITLIAGDEDRWPLAGDQLYVELDLSVENLPPGSRIAIGGAVVVVTATPHTGCRKFAERFGADAVRFVNSTEGRKLNLRGINAQVESTGPIRVGDAVYKVAARPHEGD